MKTIKLMPDYQCFPLWEVSPEIVGNINPEHLPLSAELKKELLVWADTYDATLNLDDPLSSGFQSDEEEHAFKSIGITLGERLQNELGENYFVHVQI